MARKNPIWTPRDIVTASAADARRGAKPKASKAAISVNRQAAGIGQATLRDLPTAAGRASPVSRREVAVVGPKPQAPSSRNKSADGAALTAIEVGARAIYEFRAHPKKRPWDIISEEERALYRDRMKRLNDAINGAGYQIRRA